MIINALKWLIKFIETRFPAKESFASKDSLENLWAFLKPVAAATEKHTAEIDAMKKQIEILNLRVGLSRPTQSAFGRKLNG